MAKGSDYRVVKVHPRRGGPMGNITNKAGKVLARQGQSCGGVSKKMLDSMIANGYVEKIPKPKGGGD